MGNEADRKVERHRRSSSRTLGSLRVVKLRSRRWWLLCSKAEYAIYRLGADGTETMVLTGWFRNRHEAIRAAQDRAA